MKAAKYVVLWHEDNDSGVPKHVMGSSPAFDTEDEAKAWISETVAEDRARWDARHVADAFAYDDNAEGIIHTYANCQHTYYSIEKIEWEDRAADTVEEMKKILKGRESDPPPLREWAVDIRFCPVSCVHHVMARTGEEALRKVDDMIDSRTLILTDEQKAGMMDCLLENVESTELVGPEDDR